MQRERCLRVRTVPCSICAWLKGQRDERTRDTTERRCSVRPSGRGSMATKAELIDAVATSAGVTKATKKDGEKVAWPGFGSFSQTKRAPRTGRNPQTGAPVKIAASKAMKFTPSSTLKAALNPKKKGK